MLGQFLYRIDEVLAHLGHRIFIDVGNVYAIIQKIGLLLKALGILTILSGFASCFYWNKSKRASPTDETLPISSTTNITSITEFSGHVIHPESSG